MHPRQSMKLALSLLKHPLSTVSALTDRHAVDAPGPESCVRLGADWLLLAQAMAPDGDGYSRRYSLVRGWDRCYIETTGYIIPTLLDVSDRLDEPGYRESAHLAAQWLLKVQTAEGAFTDIDTWRPRVFDTGQVLYGLMRMFRETGDERYLASVKRAARWLVDAQEADGSWVRFAYHDHPHSYYSRVGAALIDAGQLSGIEEFLFSGIRNLEWVARQRQGNGYFRHCEFIPGEMALLHTIMYVIEGFLEAYRLTGERKWADTAIEGVAALRGRSDRCGLPYSRYNAVWEPGDGEFCVTGLAQYAGALLDVYGIEREEDLLRTAATVLRYLVSRQMRRGKGITGALPSSVPIWGGYGGMEFYNWNVKFFLDGMLKWKDTGSSY